MFAGLQLLPAVPQLLDDALYTPLLSVLEKCSVAVEELAPYLDVVLRNSLTLFEIGYIMSQIKADCELAAGTGMRFMKEFWLWDGGVHFFKCCYALWRKLLLWESSVNLSLLFWVSTAVTAERHDLQLPAEHSSA